MEKVTIDNVCYELNAKNRTAVIVKGKCEGNIVIPDNITHRDIVYIIKGVGESAFYNTRTKFTKTEDSKMQMIISPISPITSIALPQSITHIEKYAFSNCTHLTSIIIPQGVTFIGEQAFEFCSLKSITLPSSISEIEDYTFQMCSSLTEVLIPNGVTRIGNGAFTGCSALTSITIPDGVTEIGEGAFSGCSSLTSIIIPETVTEIGESAFSGCSSLTSITIPKNVSYIGKNAFRGCTSVTSIIVDKNNPRYDSRDNCNAIISNDTLKIGCQKSIIPQGVTSIEDSAFENCTSLESITIPESIIHIGQNAFYNTGIYNNDSNWDKGILYIDKCLIAVKEIKQCELIDRHLYESYPRKCRIKEGTLVIGEYAFKDCTHFTSITLAKSILTIGDYAFKGCHSIKSITIPNNIEYIGYGAFKDTELYENESYWDNGVLYIDNCLIKAKTSISECLVKENTVIIANGAFASDNSNISPSLVSITIPNSVRKIGSSAFYKCASLISINIPKDIKVVESSTFEGCSSIKSIYIPNGVVRIGDSAFSCCRNLSTINFPDTVTTIEQSAFQGCSSLTAINIPNNVQEISNGVFWGCSSLMSINIPNSIITIGNSAFYRCNKLTSITIPESVTTIKGFAFGECSAITSVKLPHNIIKFEEHIFDTCRSLQTIIVPAGKKEIYCKLGLENLRRFIVEKQDTAESIPNTHQEEYIILLNIAKGYELGIGVMKNLAQAVLCYSQAAEKGCAEAAYHLGELYETGKGLPLNYSLAIDWYTKAANLSHPDALNRKQYCQQQLLNEQ